MSITLQQYGQDTVQGTHTSGINPASDGQSYTQASGIATPSIITASGLNRIQLTGDTAANVFFLGSRQFTDVDCSVRVSVSALEVRASLIARATDYQTYYRASIKSGVLLLELNQGGVKTTLNSLNLSYSPSTYYWLHFRLQGFGAAASNPNNLLVNFWADPTNGTGTTPSGEPDGWMLEAGDGTLTNPGSFGFAYTPAHTSEWATFDYFSATDVPAPANLPALLLNTSVADEVASSTVNPYGVTYFVASTPPPFPQQLVADLVGPNPVTNVGWGPGANCRYQLVWNVVNPLQGFYDWALLDHAVQLCNAAGVRLFYTFDNPPSWAQTLDSMGNDATLTSGLTAGTGYSSLPVTALREGAYLPHGYQLSVGKGGANPETVYIWNPGNTYTAGATSIGISTSQSSQVAWHPAHNHSIGEYVQEASRANAYANATAMTAFATAVATRYNGLNGYGKIDVFQVGNENYDIQNRCQNQGSYNQGTNSPASWDMSSTYDNGGAILAPVYVAVKAAIANIPGHSDTPVFANAVRKTPNTGRQHIINWTEGFVQGVLALGGKIDGVDFHFYHTVTDWNGATVQDPTVSTYTDSTETVINAPSIAVELSDLHTVFARHNISPMIACCEFGWDIYDDGAGANAATTATYSPASGALTSLAVDASTWAHGSHTGGVAIPDATPIYIDYQNPASTEVVYAYGAIASGASSLPITTNPLGSSAAQAAWTPASTHASGIIVYAQTSITPLSQATQALYTEDMYDALMNGGATYGFVFTINPPVSNINTNHNPPSAQNTKGLTTTTGGVYGYTTGYVATAQYAVAHPSWPGSVSGGNSLYASTILADSPTAWWRLDEASGVVALDSSGNHHDTTLVGNIARGQPSALISDVTESTQFGGPDTVDVPRLYGGTIMGLSQPGGGIVFPAGCDPSAWSAASVDFWVLLSGEVDWRYIAVTNGSMGLLCYLDAELVASSTLQGILGLTGGFSMAQLVGFLKSVTSTCDMEEVGVYPAQLSAVRLAAHYQAGTGYSVGTPLSVFGSSVASSTLPTAGSLATTTGGADGWVATKIGKASGYGELYALGSTANWPKLSALPDVPTGNGWLLDSSLLSNQRLLAGLWQVVLTARLSMPGLILIPAGTGIFADLYVRAWAYNTSSQTYTPIGALELTNQQITIVSQLILPSDLVSLPTYAFNSHEMLYIEAWANITQNNTGSAAALLQIKLATTGTGAANDVQVSTPGYVPVTAVSTAYTAYIAGAPVFVNAGSLTIDSQIGQRSTAQLTVHNTKAGLHFAWRSRVAVFDASGGLAFSGYIDTPDEVKPGFQHSHDTQIQCIDQHWLADKRRVNATFTNKSIGQIVHWLWKNVLAQEGVKIGQIWSGTLPGKSLLPSATLVPSSGGVDKIASATFYYCTVAEALDELVKQASLSGTPFYWNIDYHKRLYFVPYTAITNSTVLDGTTLDALSNPPKVTRQSPLYRNTQYIVESFNNAGPFHKTITGDGKTTNWTMDYPLASAPTITVAGKSQSVGIKGSSTSAQWLWAAGDPVIAQGPGATPLAGPVPPSTPAVTAKVTYNGQYKDVAKYTDSGLVDAQKALDGTSGIVEDAVENPTLAPAAVALKIAKKYVQRYGVKGIQAVVYTLSNPYAAGEWVKVDLSQYGLSGKFLVEKVEASDQQDSYNIWFALTLIQGPYDASPAFFWKNLLKSKPAANTINVGISSASG